MQILVVEDNTNMSELIRAGLAENGYSADVYGNASEGEEAALIKTYDVIVLDRRLPDKDGLELCRVLRQRGVKTPILMLTALGATDERVTGLNAGADDYLPKPFAFDELVARLRALMRRGEAGEATTLRYADVEIDLLRRAVTRAGVPIRLRNKEYELLEFFVRRHDRVLTRTTIAEHVWDINYEVSSNVIDVSVGALRRKVDKGFDKPLIHTIIGVGYMFSIEGPTI
ncbi:MAG: response regulator transcription factor [Phycisphaerales bacterium]|nr:response regulator transcription factor [Phycisphaerales bacterium]